MTIPNKQIANTTRLAISVAFHRICLRCRLLPLSIRLLRLITRLPPLFMMITSCATKIASLQTRNRDSRRCPDRLEVTERAAGQKLSVTLAVRARGVT